MCSAPKPPTPVAPPAPLPARDASIDANRSRQDASRRSAQSGYAATVLTGGSSSPASTASPILGG